MVEEAIKNDIERPLCFVVGPIGSSGSPIRKHSDFLLYAVFKYVLESEEFGYFVKRADEDADPGMIGDRVIHDIVNAALVVADLTDLNPNAFYELGIRHATEKPTIHVAKAGTPLPFDNISHRTIFLIYRIGLILKSAVGGSQMPCGLLSYLVLKSAIRLRSLMQVSK